MTTKIARVLFICHPYVPTEHILWAQSMASPKWSIHHIVYILLSQVYKGNPVSKLCDVYSYGILLWEIITFQQPFANIICFLVPQKVMDGEVSATDK